MKKVMQLGLIAFALTSFLFVAGCNTMQGMGKDISKGGQAITKAAKKDDGNSNKK